MTFTEWLMVLVLVVLIVHLSIMDWAFNLHHKSIMSLYDIILKWRNDDLNKQNDDLIKSLDLLILRTKAEDIKQAQSEGEESAE